MKNLEWCLLAKAFFAFKYVAEPLGFYTPELAKMEESLNACRPFKGDKAIMEKVKSLYAKKNSYRRRTKRFSAVQVKSIDRNGVIELCDKATPEWFNTAVKNGIIFTDENNTVKARSITYGTHAILSGDFIIYHTDGQLEVVDKHEFAMKYEAA